MVICVTYWWSPFKNEEVLKKYFEAVDKYPAIVKSVKIYLKYMRKGTQATAYFEVEEGKLEETMNTITTMYNEFVEEIESFTYEIGLQTTIEEVLASRTST
jgi:hypothetical protein